MRWKLVLLALTLVPWCTAQLAQAASPKDAAIDRGCHAPEWMTEEQRAHWPTGVMCQVTDGIDPFPTTTPIVPPRVHPVHSTAAAPTPEPAQHPWIARLNPAGFFRSILSTAGGGTRPGR